MRRAAAAIAVLSLLAVVAPLAIRAQEPADDKLNELIETLRKALTEKEALAKERKPLTFVSHLYDIRDLTHQLRDYPGEEPNLAPSGGFGFGFSGEEAEAMPYFEGDAIADMIRENVVPESWDELTSVDCQYHQSGMLAVRHTPGVHRRIADLLDELRSRAGSQVTVRFRLLRIPDAALREALGAGAGAVLSDEGADLLEAAIRAGKAKVVRDGRIACTNTQRVALSDLAQVSYMSDYDVEIAQGASIGDPIVRSVSEGFIGDVRPIIAGDGSLVILEIRASSNRLVRPMGVVATPVGEIQVPHVEQLKIRTTVSLPLGKSAVIGGALSDGDDDGLLLVVTPVAARPGRK